MKAALSMALAKWIGQPLTLEIARQIIADTLPDACRDPVEFGTKTYGGLVFQVERFADIEEEMHRLHEVHWLETEGHRHGLLMRPDHAYPAFKEDERTGRLIQFTARADGVLVGNIRMYIYTSRHTETLAAKEDTFYVLPPFRKGFAAVRFWLFMEQCLKSIGVQEITTDSKVINKAARLSEYMGYTHVSSTYHKFLKD